MAHATTLARPYARAVFSQAQAEGTMVSWLHLLRVLAAIVAIPESVSLFQCWIPAKQHLLYDILYSLIPEPLLATQRTFVDLLIVRSQRWRCVAQIYQLVQQMHCSATGRVEVLVQTAYALLPPQKASMQAALERQVTRPVDMKELVSPELIGGVVIHIYDNIIDGSVRGRIQHMAHAFFE